MKNLKNTCQVLLLVSLLISAFSLPLAQAETSSESAFDFEGYEIDNFDHLFFFEEHDGGTQARESEVELRAQKELPPECLTPVWAMCTVRRPKR